MLVILFLIMVGDGGMPGAFLNYGLTPRTLSMGKSFTGLANDAEAGYYNPAGLVQLMSHDLKLAHSQLYGGFRMEYLGYGFPTRRFGYFGFTLINHGVEDVESRVSLTEVVGTYSYRQNGVIFSYAYQFLKELGLGGNIKVITSNIANFGAVGLGGDAGFFLFPKGSITFGGVVQNLFGPKLTYHTVEDVFPLTFRIGSAVKFYRDQIILLGDLVKPGSNSLTPHMGLEYRLLPIVTLRGGVDKNELSAGLGLRKDWGKLSLAIDYAILFHHQSNYLLPLTHKIGLILNFGGFRTW
ncbi:MAG: PorV/PorQ family protein, partial [candidate division WOR-3 bacterium]